MNQLELFADNRRHIRPRDTHVVPEERPRLSGQNARILERLRRGPATNDELSGIARKYTSRISDLRAAGHDVRVIEHDRTTGVVLYKLMEQ